MAAKTPEDADRLFAERVNAGNVDGVLALYEPGATLVMPEGDLTGHAAFRESMQQMIAAQLRVQLTVTKVVCVEEDLAVLYNDWRGSMKGPNGNQRS
jgi:ketosteroid isomerase-like protein